MKTITHFEHSVTETPHWLITMDDGVVLSARVWMPDSAVDTPVPAIVEHLPYRKRDGTIARDEITHPYFSGHGYACIRVDMRGNGESEGLMTDEYTAQELDDARQVIEWAAVQPWCNGKVGMMGISWGGFNSLQLAALQPEPLKAIVTVCSSVDRYADDIHYKGGCLLNTHFAWTCNMLSYSSRPPDPALVGDDWKRMWMERLENQPFLISRWLREQTRSDFWKHGSVCENYSAISAAVLSVGGWHDGYRNTIAHLVSNLSSPAKGIVGPWIHKYPHYAGPQPAIGFLQECLRWWDRWLKDKPNDAENDPAYRAWVMDSVKPERWLPERPGRWIKEERLPSDNIQATQWALGVNTLQQDGNVTSFDEPLLVNTLQHCGAASGDYFPFAFGPELPDEQSTDDGLSVCFDSVELDDAIDIVGAPAMRLRVTPDTAVAQLAVRLCDVRADGCSAHITSGFLNLCSHQSFENPQRLIPGEQIDCEVVLDQIAYRVSPGSRLRIAISNSYWPFIWPAAEHGTLTIDEGALNLPVRPSATANECEFQAAEGSVAWQTDSLREGSTDRSTSVDADTGVVTTIIDIDFGEQRDKHHGLISGGKKTEIYRIHPDNPQSAVAEIHWEQTGGRDDWRWRTSVSGRMHCDATHFYVLAEVTAYENGNTVFTKTYEDKIQRWGS